MPAWYEATEGAREACERRRGVLSEPESPRQVVAVVVVAVALAAGFAARVRGVPPVPEPERTAADWEAASVFSVPRERLACGSEAAGASGWAASAR